MRKQSFWPAIFVLVLLLCSAACAGQPAAERPAALEAPPAAEAAAAEVPYEDAGEAYDDRCLRIAEPYRADPAEAFGAATCRKISERSVRVPQEGVVSEEGVRLFWEIVVDNTRVSTYAAYEQAALDAGGEPSYEGYIQDSLTKLARKNIYLYKFAEGSGFQVLAHEFALPVDADLPCLYDSGQFAVGGGDALYFKNCYLKIADPGLAAQAGEWLDIDLAAGFEASYAVLAEDLAEEEKAELEAQVRAFLEALSTADSSIENSLGGQIQARDGKVYYAGENVRLDVEFLAEGAGAQPLFHYPQYYAFAANEDLVPLPTPLPGAVLGAELISEPAGAKSAVWQVRADEATALTCYDRSLAYDDLLESDFHTLVVRQETEIDPDLPLREPYFEYCLDGRAVRKPAADEAIHLFYTGEQQFYVAFSPDYVGPRFEGYIRKIVFDPNASCWSC